MHSTFDTFAIVWRLAVATGTAAALSAFVSFNPAHVLDCGKGFTSSPRRPHKTGNHSKCLIFLHDQMRKLRLSVNLSALHTLHAFIHSVRQ